MYSLSGTPNEDESTPLERYPTVEESEVLWATWTIRLLTITYIAAVLYHLWTDETIRAYSLHMMTHFLQSLARRIGGWGINTENSYNTLVAAWH